MGELVEMAQPCGLRSIIMSVIRQIRSNVVGLNEREPMELDMIYVSREMNLPRAEFGKASFMGTVDA